ncbi:hypothetical protein C8Q74DRAFT_634877 [Fomes fomentarius]|nr:hypothetical protein C8Q74DRAFT_634877 [Fomes fomentarius]
MRDHTVKPSRYARISLEFDALWHVCRFKWGSSAPHHLFTVESSQVYTSSICSAPLAPSRFVCRQGPLSVSQFLIERSWVLDCDESLPIFHPLRGRKRSAMESADQCVYLPFSQTFPSVYYSSPR